MSIKARATIVFLIIAIGLLSGCTILDIKHVDSFSCFLHPTEGARIEQNGTIDFVPSVEDLSFNGIALQLYSLEPVNYLESMVWTTEPGVYNGEYVHNLESGVYLVRLKLNGTTSDEYVEIRVNLVNGQKYNYAFKVKSFDEKSAIIENYTFGIVK